MPWLQLSGTEHEGFVSRDKAVRQELRGRRSSAGGHAGVSEGPGAQAAGAVPTWAHTAPAHCSHEPRAFEEELSASWNGMLLSYPGGAGEAVPGLCGCGHSPEKAVEAGPAPAAKRAPAFG